MPVELAIKNLRTLFAIFGIPKEIVSNNGPQFTLEEFTKFCIITGTVHKKTSPQMKQQKTV